MKYRGRHAQPSSEVERLCMRCVKYRVQWWHMALPIHSIKARKHYIYVTGRVAHMKHMPAHGMYT